MLPIKQRVKEATDVVRKAWLDHDDCSERPEVIITTGSGLGSLVEDISSPLFEISYEAIPHLPPSRVDGHAGRIVIGRCGGSKGKKVVVLDGRIHGYEGHDPLTQVLPLLIAHQLCGGSPLALFTNAAGAINESYHIGQLVLIKDHINFTGETLVNFNQDSDFGGSNLDMTFAYTPEPRDLLKELARAQNIDVAEGVYVGVKGAMFETPAEICAFRTWGADVVGMSTVHEVVAASRLGMSVAGISVVTNMAAGIEAKKLTHQEVLENTRYASNDVARMIAGLLDATPCACPR